MKNLKKIISIVLCIAMMFTVSVGVMADENDADTNKTPVITNQEPEETPVPEVAPTPEETLAPEATQSPEESPAPEATPTPEETLAPEATSTPEETPAPVEPPVENNGEITVQVNGVNVVFDDVKPQIIDGRTLVPIRKVGEALNAAVAWRQIDGTVHIFRNGTTVMLTIGKAEMAVREYEYGDKFIYTTEPIPDKFIDPENKEVVARTINDRTMIPFRAVCEALGAKVDWDGTKNQVIVSIPQYTLTLADRDAANLIENWNYKPSTVLKTGTVAVKIYGNFMGADAALGDGITVVLDGKTQTAANGGTCAFSDVKAGTYTLTLNHIPEGYIVENADKLNVTVEAGKEASVMIGLVKVPEEVKDGEEAEDNQSDVKKPEKEEKTDSDKEPETDETETEK